MADWFYYNENGEKTGPLSVPEMKELTKRGVIKRDTFIENTNGQSDIAGNIRGFEFPEKKHVLLQPIPTELESERLFCTNCGSPVSEYAIVCMSCGAAPIGHIKFCRHCGVGLNPEQIVCIKCGSEIETKGMSSLARSSTTIGDVLIFAAAALAFISFFLPWIEVTIPMVKISKNGFSVHAFWLGIVFIYPLWIAMAKWRTVFDQEGGYICAGIGILVGIALPLIRIEIELKELSERRREMARELITVGAGVYLFIGACIILIVGVALIKRLFNSTWET